MKKDTVYSRPGDRVDAFRFDAQVADVFENMINRSVPGYSLVLDMIGVFTRKYALPNTNCYDLGCSLGASTLQIRHYLPASCHVIGVDNSPDMVERCRRSLARDHSEASIEIREQDLLETTITNASIVAMNFTLQFVPDERRSALLKNIADGMVQGGALILSEKIRADDEDEQAFLTELHEAFKKYQGYSDLEIAQKRAALENVLVPNTVSEHLERLNNAGFSTSRLCIQCLNFATFLAIR